MVSKLPFYCCLSFNSYRVTGQKTVSQQSSTDLSEEDMAIEGGIVEPSPTDTTDLSSKPTANGTATTPSPSKAATKR